jgi:hypothetical protein
MAACIGVWCSLQGIDSRKTGHYVYFSVDSGVPASERLHAKNKTAVKDWLERVHCADVAADRGTVAVISEPSEAEVEDLLQDHGDPKTTGKILAVLAARASKAKSAGTHHARDPARCPVRVYHIA